MKPSEQFYTAPSETPTCCTCANWVATRIFSRDAFMCPNGGLGSCNATQNRSLTTPQNSCHSWQPWKVTPQAQPATT